MIYRELFVMNWLKNKLCDWFHAGGDIKRDCHGRINWQCRTCSRWADPVDPQTARLITDNAIEEAILARGKK
jgi:hypothetical protein